MYPQEDEATLTLPKWPFYLGDGLLVGVAILIASLSNWQLKGIEVVACVLAVALGAALMTLPFIAEYFMRVREETDDRSSELRLLKKQLQEAEAAMLQQHERLAKLESHASLEDQRYELLASAVDDKTQGESPDVTAFSKQLSDLEAFKAEQTKASGKAKKELAALEQSVQQAIESLAAIQSQLDALEKANKDRAAESTGDKTEDAKLSDKKKTVSQKESAKAESTEAVSSEIDPVLEALPDDFSVSIGADLMMDDDFFDADESGKQENTAAGNAKKTSAKPVPASTERKETSSVETSVVSVSRLMGIGNKPFLRGSGGGLNWEVGVEMDFQEVGKWTWSAPSDLKEPIKVHVYQNDKDADRKGKYILNPGEPLEIAPDF